MVMAPGERKAGFIMGGITLAEGFWVYANMGNHPARLFRYAGFPSTGTGVLGWALAAAVALVYTRYAAELPSVRANLFRPSSLKVLAVLLALVACLCEECVFRKALMDALSQRGYGVVIQLAGSALAFGLVHAIWGLMRGSFGAALRAMLATGSLGLALAIVYVASHRIVASCVAAHFLINLFAEPGLILAVVRGEMSAAPAPRQPY